MSQLTVLQAPGRCLTKIYGRDRKGGIVKRAYDNAALFYSRVHIFEGIDGLFALQGMLQRRQDCCVIHAPPGRWHPGDSELANRRVYAAAELADDRGRFHKPARKGADEFKQRQDVEAGRLRPVTVLPAFEAVPTALVLLDFEKVVLPAGIAWRDDIAYTAAYLRQNNLPDGFHGRRCTYFATSSAADLTKPDLGGDEIRMRLGFMLDRPLTTAEAKRWLADVDGLDRCTLQSNQPIYTAAPVFRDGLQDPMPERLGMLDGEHELVAVPRIEMPRQIERARFTSLGPVRSAEGLGLLGSLGMDAALERLAELGGGSGSVRSSLRQAIFAYVRDVGRDRVDIDALADALTTAAGPYRSASEIAGYGLEGLIAWCLEQVPAEPPPKPHYPARGLPAEEATAELRREMAGIVAEAVAWGITSADQIDGLIDLNKALPPPRTGFKVGAGGGKTAAALDEIAAIPGIEQMHVEIYVPDHTLAKELAERIHAGVVARRPPVTGGNLDFNVELRAVVIHGRGTADNPDRTALCKKAGLAEQVAKAGLNVMGSLCRLKGKDGEPGEECEFAASCPYLAQFRNRAPAIRILPHANLFVARNKDLPVLDLIVVDERFWPNAVVHTRLALDRLTEASRWRARPRKGEAPWKASDRTMEAEDFAIRVRNAFQDGRDPRTVVTAKDCGSVAAIEWGSLTGPGITPGIPHARQMQLWNAWQRDECAKAGRFWNLLEEEHEHPERPLQRIVLERDAPTRDSDRRHLLHLHYRREMILPTVPVIVLDADLDPLIAEKFMPGLRVVEIPVIQQAHIVQVVDRSCSMRFLLGAEDGDEREHKRAARRRSELQQLAVRLLAGCGLLVSYKGVLERLQLPTELATLHLGNLRGRDGYKHLDTAVIAGRLEPGALTVERMARALFGDEAEPLQAIAPDEAGRVRYPIETRRCRMAGLLTDAAGPAVDVPVHPDRRAQAILEQVRERELEQAIARLRLVHRDRPATVYVLTNIPLDLEIAEVVTWNTLCRDRMAGACHRWGGVWLVSPSEQSRCAPDLWPSAGAAKQWAMRNKGTKCSREYTRALRTLIPAYPAWGGHDPARSVVTVIEYRLAGQRGPHPHRAFIPGDVFCRDTARADLEAVTGPVAKLQIIGTVHREQPGVVVSIEAANRSDPDFHIDHPAATLPMDDRLPLSLRPDRRPLAEALEHAGPPFAATSPPASIRRSKSAARSAAVLAAVDSSAPGIIVNFEATVPELAEIRSGNRCRLCSKRMAWPGPAGLIFADGTAECHPCADASATLGVYFWSSHPRSAGPESAADRQAVGAINAAQQGVLLHASFIQTDRR